MKNYIISIFLLIGVLSIVFSCKSKKTSKDNELPTNQIFEKKGVHKYTIIKIGNGAINLIKKPTLNIDFEKNTIRGNNGCNQYSGIFQINEKKQLTIDKLKATEMYCQETASIEKAFNNALANSTQVEFLDKTILFYNAKNRVLLVGEKE